MKQIKQLQQQLDDFNNYVQQLGVKINHSNIQWQDEKYQSIKIMINEFASSSKKVLQIADVTLKSLHQFERELK